MIVPEATPLTRPYWEGAKAHELRLQHCSACSHTWHPPAPACSACGSTAFHWEASTGEGTVHSFIIVDESPDPAMADRLPLIIALIRLREGPLVITNIVDCQPGEVSVEMPVQVDWQELAAGIVLPQFRPQG